MGNVKNCNNYWIIFSSESKWNVSIWLTLISGFHCNDKTSYIIYANHDRDDARTKIKCRLLSCIHWQSHRIRSVISDRRKSMTKLLEIFLSFLQCAKIMFRESLSFVAWELALLSESFHAYYLSTKRRPFLQRNGLIYVGYVRH